VQNHLPAHLEIVREDTGGFERRANQHDDDAKAKKDFEEETLQSFDLSPSLFGRRRDKGL
jgi:hypothetical protein